MDEQLKKQLEIAKHLMLQDKHSTIISREKASLGNTNRWLKK